MVMMLHTKTVAAQICLEWWTVSSHSHLQHGLYLSPTQSLTLSCTQHCFAFQPFANTECFCETRGPWWALPTAAACVGTHQLRRGWQKHPGRGGSNAVAGRLREDTEAWMSWGKGAELQQCPPVQMPVVRWVLLDKVVFQYLSKYINICKPREWFGLEGSFKCHTVKCPYNG